MPFDSTTTCSTDASGTQTCITLYGSSTSTTQSVINGFSYGEIVIASFLLILTLATLYQFFYHSVKAQKTR